MGLRTRICRQCGESFTYQTGTGRDRWLCSEACRESARRDHAAGKPPCGVDGCENRRQYANPPVCNSCWYRLRRTGTLERRQWAHRTVGTNGYVRLIEPGHPLAVRGYVYEHRAVLYAAIGPGEHACHWCKAPVSWARGRIGRGVLVPDHLDGNKANNHIGNLVPACNPCNVARAQFMKWLDAHGDDPALWALLDTRRKVAG